MYNIKALFMLAQFAISRNTLHRKFFQLMYPIGLCSSNIIEFVYILKITSYFIINHTIDCNRHCTVNGVILQLPAVKRFGQYNLFVSLV